MSKLAAKRSKRRKAVKQRAVPLYSVSGAYETGEEVTEYVGKSDACQVALFARTELGFDIVTAVKLVNDCVWL